LRIAIFSDSLSPRVDGIAVAVQHLAGGLVERGHDVLLVGPGESVLPGAAFLRLASIPTPVDGYPLAIIRRARVEQELTRFRPTLVSVHTIGPTGLLGFSLAQRHRVQMLFSWHTDFESYSRTYRISRLLAASSYVYLDRRPKSEMGTEPVDLITARLRQAAIKMAAVCAPSSGAVEQVRRFGIRRPVFVMPTDVTPGDLGVGTEAATIAAQAIPGLGFTPYLLYVGRLSREKNLGLLLAAFARLEAEGRAAEERAVRLVLVGPAKDARTWALLRAETSDRIVLLGALPRRHLGEIYRRAAVFVTPSLSETQCLCVCEAIVVGTRVLVADPRLAVDHPVGTVRIAAPTPAGLAAAMSDLLRTTRPSPPIPGKDTESLAVRFVAAIERAGTAALDTVLRWDRDRWVVDPSRYG
jgi:1,2-diacylglycerol 3-alpha-glucosyltransferase